MQKTVTIHVWEQYMELVEDYRHTKKYSDIYKLRKETIERVFGDAKEKHGMRYTNYRGLAKVTAETALRFACMNLKKLAKWKRKNGMLPPQYYKKSFIFNNIVRQTAKWFDFPPRIEPFCLQSEMIYLR